MNAKDQGSPHRQIQAAHEQYFQDIANAWNRTQSTFAAIQTDLERATEQAFSTQDNDAYQNAMSEIQAASREAWEEASSGRPFEEALRNYKANIQKAVAGADLDSLTFTDLAHLGQSLSTVWPVAFSLAQAAMANQGQPFQGFGFQAMQAPGEEASSRGASRSAKSKDKG